MKKLTAVLLFSLALNLCFAEETEQALKVEISSEKSVYKLGEPIEVKLKIINTTEEGIRVIFPCRFMIMNEFVGTDFNLIFKIYNEEGENAYPQGDAGFQPTYPTNSSIIELRGNKNYVRKILIAYYWPPEEKNIKKRKGVWTLVDKHALIDIYSFQKEFLSIKLKPRYRQRWEKLPWITDQKPGKYRVIAFYRIQLSEKAEPVIFKSNELVIDVVE